MYSRRTGLIIGFHGCDQNIRDKVVNNQESLIPSTNDYDWLGHGIYFWENNLYRAQDYAEQLKNNSKKANPLQIPSVLGSVINLGSCLDLTESDNLILVKQA